MIARLAEACCAYKEAPCRSRGKSIGPESQLGVAAVSVEIPPWPCLAKASDRSLLKEYAASVITLLRSAAEGLRRLTCLLCCSASYLGALACDRHIAAAPPADSFTVSHRRSSAEIWLRPTPVRQSNVYLKQHAGGENSVSHNLILCGPLMLAHDQMKGGFRYIRKSQK